MSHFEIANVANSNPAIPTSFPTDSGTAVPVANTLNINGGTQAAGTHPIQTTGAGNTVRILGQFSQAIGASNATNVGLAAFNSAHFTVDANGFVALSGAIGQTITGNSGGALSPTAGNWNILGTGSITTSGAGSTLTAQLTGLTNHAILVGAGTATITNVGPTATTGQVLQNNAGADPTYSTATYPATTTINQILYSSLTNVVSGLTTANNGVLVTSNSGVPSILAGPGTTGQILQANAAAAPSFSTASYPSTTTINQILYSSAANTVAGLATANNGVLTTGTTGIPVITALAADGQLIIGSSIGAPAAATITAGAGITVTNGHNSITIAAAAGGMTWTDTSGIFTAASNNGYMLSGASTPTLPAAPALGDVIIFICDTASTVTVTANAGQRIRIGTSQSAVAGTAASSTQGNALTVRYRASDTTWITQATMGTWTVT